MMHVKFYKHKTFKFKLPGKVGPTIVAPSFLELLLLFWFAVAARVLLKLAISVILRTLEGLPTLGGQPL